MRSLRALPALLALCLLPVAARASTILSENFDELTPQLAVTSAGAFTTINGTNVDIVGGGLFGGLCAAPASGNCIDLDGSGGLSQGVLQSGSLTLLPGTSYFLSFDLLGDGRGGTGSATVDFGPYSQLFTLASGDDATGIVTNLLITVNSPTTTNLTFSSDTPGNVGLILDNVSVTASTSTATTPEPPSLLLLGSALLLALVPMRRHLAHR